MSEQNMKIRFDFDALLNLLEEITKGGGLCDNDGRGCPCVERAAEFLEARKKHAEGSLPDNSKPMMVDLMTDSTTGLQFWKKTYTNMRGELSESWELANVSRGFKGANGVENFVSFSLKQPAVNQMEQRLDEPRSNQLKIKE